MDCRGETGRDQGMTAMGVGTGSKGAKTIGKERPPRAPERCIESVGSIKAVEVTLENALAHGRRHPLWFFRRLNGKGRRPPRLSLARHRGTVGQ